MPYSHSLGPLLLSALLFLCASCETTRPPNPSWAADHSDEPIQSMSAENAEIAQRIQKARDLVASKEYTAAEQVIRPIVHAPAYREEITILLNAIKQGQDFVSRKLAQEQSAAIAVGEVERRLVLPDSYGRTVLITPNMDPQNIPAGPMEELYKKPVDLAVYGADVRTIVIALSEIDGLNIIADEALSGTSTSQGTLSKRVDDIADKLAIPGATASAPPPKTIDVNVKQVPLGELLAYIAANLGIAFHLGEHMVWVTEAADDSNRGPDLETRVYRLNRGYIPGFEAEENPDNGNGFGGERDQRQRVGSASQTRVALEAQDDLENALADFLEKNPNNPPDADYKLFRNNNVLMIRNNRENLRLAEAIMHAFDVIPPQILIEARFITIGQGDLFQLGVTINELGYTDDDGRSRFEASASGPDLPFGSPEELASGRLTLSGVIDQFTYGAVLEAVERARTSETLSAPRVTVLNNQQASIRKGTTEFFYEEFERGNQNIVTNDTTDDSNNGALVPTGRPTQLDTGISLNVKPSLGHDRRGIMLALSASITEFIEFTSFQYSEGDLEIRLPKIDENTLTTVATVNSGETVVLGGMLETTQNHTESKLPFFGDLPVLGNLFRKRDSNIEPRHLLIFLTATIVDRDGQFNTASPRETVP